MRRRNWLTHEEFLDRLGAANLIPGPSSTEMAIHIGFLKRGWQGLIVAGCCFIIPAAIMVTAIAAAYMAYGSLPRIGGILYGLKPVVIAIIVQAFWKLAQTAVKNPFLAGVVILATIASALAVNNLTVILLAGAIAALPRLWNKLAAVRFSSSAFVFQLQATAMKPAMVFAAAVAMPVTLLRLFLTF